MSTVISQASPDKPDSAYQFVTRKAFEKMLAMSRSSFYRRQAEDKNFPMPEKRGGKLKFVEEEVKRYIDLLKASRQQIHALLVGGAL